MSSVLIPDLRQACVEPQHIDGEPERVRRVRAQAAERFSALGWPTTRLEAWKYTSLVPLTNVDWKTDPSEGDDPVSPFGDHPIAELVFVNGGLRAIRSTVNDHPG